MDTIEKLSSCLPRFLIVYIREAHAEDTWPLGLSFPVQQTYCTSNRCVAATSLIKRHPLQCEIMVDEAPDNLFDQFFAVWPLRFYVIDVVDDRVYISFIGEPHGEYMDLGDLEKYLEQRNFKIPSE